MVAPMGRLQKAGTSTLESHLNVADTHTMDSKLTQAAEQPQSDENELPCWLLNRTEEEGLHFVAPGRRHAQDCTVHTTVPGRGSGSDGMTVRPDGGDICCLDG